jgi:hypothetical protein
MCRWVVVSLIVALSSVPPANAQSRCQLTWTLSGAGAGFGIGVWTGLSAFDDAVSSDRKVWIEAARPRGRPETTDPRLLEQLGRSIRFDRGGHVDGLPISPMKTERIGRSAKD